MSDHEEGASEIGDYVPISELDDHRHQSPSTQIPERPRRGTFDTLYGSRYTDAGPADEGDVRVRDFEEAVIDDDAGPDVSPHYHRSRRPTVDTQRSVSPPNSVKAFAEARRREREASVSEPNWQPDDEGLQRAASAASRRSLRSRPRTIDNETASLVSRRSAEADVCFPVHDEHRKDVLHIDFEYLDDFIEAQRMFRTASNRESDERLFSDLEPQTSATSPAAAAAPALTVQGEVMGISSDDADGGDEKSKTNEEQSSAERGPRPIDPNRICFFSSAWESTIHAAELGDLVLPGEDVRGLFKLPEEGDGVWWLNVNNPSKDEVVAICKAFGTHPLTTEDIATQESREKIELFPSYYFACFRSFNTELDPDGNEEYEPFNIYAIVFREGTLSFSFAPNGHASNVRKRIALLKDFVSLSSDWVCYALM
jgi:magnesium transporter